MKPTQRKGNKNQKVKTSDDVSSISYILLHNELAQNLVAPHNRYL